MATAKKTQIEVVQKVHGVVLTLSPDEAYALAAVLAKIGGPETTTPRGLTSGIGRALSSVGFCFDDDNSPIKRLSGRLSFHRTEAEALAVSRGSF